VTDLTPEALAAKVRHVMGSNASWDRIDVGLGEQALSELVERAAALDAERARTEAVKQERDDWAETALRRAGINKDLREQLDAERARTENLEEALADAGVDPVDYILSRPNYEEREEAAKCLYAAAVLADGYGKKETARRFRKAGAGLKTRPLDAGEDTTT